MSEDRYAEWDGAYVMGALSPAERHEYEQHLAHCPACAGAVAELGPLPGLLARVDPVDAEALLAGPVPPELADPPADLLARVIESTRPLPPWWARPRARIGLAAAAAAVVAAAVAVPLAVRHDDRPAGVDVSLGAVGPLSADVDLVSRDWGTEVDMTCWYADEGTPEPDRPYALYVLDRAGKAELVSRWHAGPGDTSRTVGSTDLAVADIARLQLRTDSGTVLLQAATPD